MRNCRGADSCPGYSRQDEAILSRRVGIFLRFLDPADDHVPAVIARPARVDLTREAGNKALHGADKEKARASGKTEQDESAAVPREIPKGYPKRHPSHHVA